MKKSAIVVFFTAFMSIAALAQNVQEGLNNLYAQRFQSAKSSFEKQIASNPNNIEAIYWLGQTYLLQGNTAGARSLYEKALGTSNNAPLIVAGMGHVLLLEGKSAEARQQFEAAVNASRGKKGGDPVVLNAVGRANVESYTETAKRGDLDYAISKLNEAAGLAPTNGDILINLGNAYRKKRDATSGGLAVQSFRKAAAMPGTAAIGYYRIARIYETQVSLRRPDDWTVVLENLNNALTADPKFAPAYEELYTYYLLGKKDFPKAEELANKYIASSDPSVENDYLRAQTQFVQNNFSGAITTAKNIVSQTNNDPKPRVYRLLAFSYLGMKDTTTACDYVNQFFNKAKDDDIYGTDYILHASACGRNNPDLMRADITKGIMMDSVPSRQITMLDEQIADSKLHGQRLLTAELSWLKYQIQGEKANPATLIATGTDFYFSSQFQKADSLFQLYSKAFPDSIYGYLWSARANVQLDTAMTLGLAVPYYEQMLRVAETDKTRDLYKSSGLSAAGYLFAYSYNTKKDKAAARTYLDRGLAFDPTNATLKSYEKALQGSGTQKNTTTANEAKSKDAGTKTKVEPNKAKVKSKN
jgi:tetratricopeptide (TPR) repeat protein